jgi:DNA-binding winged helix-turn-helix (wHTH) protein
LDLRAAELRKHGVKIRLQEQPFRILAMLLAHPGEVVLREEIRRKLWPNDTIVEFGHGINAAVQRLREALGESAEKPRHIETLARRGYRFLGEVEVVEREPPAADPAPEACERTATADRSGATVSHYRVLDKLGGGGMGVVYRAQDLKLGRQVALKFLPEELADHPAALERFEREARAASALNHPNVCTVYEVEEWDGQPVIVLELVEGETLAARLESGPLPVAQSLALAIQIADALDAAHRKGIVHRDLKPANLAVTKSGVKVLDFGLAQMEGATAGGVGDAASAAGTPNYMSPEQAQGLITDARSDIYSFGLVLYEMMAGRRAFSAAGAVLQPIGGGVPAAVDGVVRRCLAQDPEERWQSARDLKSALQCMTEWEAPPVRPVRRQIRWQSWHWALAGAAAMLCVWLAVALIPDRRGAAGDSTPSAAVRFTIDAPGGPPTRLSVSPDGRRLAFVSGGRIYVRALDSLEARPLEGTEGAGTPFWSPDGKRLAFPASGKLRNVDLNGGPPISLCDVNTNVAGTWGPDGTILIGLVGDGIFRVKDAGGTLTRVTVVDPARGQTRHLLPLFLPGGRRFLYVAGGDRPDSTMLYAASLDSAGSTPVMPVSSDVSYVPPRSGEGNGWLIFAQDRTLMARRFDARALRPIGDAVPLAGPAGASNARGAVAVDVVDFSAAGETLAYRSVVPTPQLMAKLVDLGVQRQLMGSAMDGGKIAVIQNWRAAVKR